ncbi:DUF4386 family protein [Nocardioides speluncae]|uniref:DUF4386 family protein n=1 Tax=Nocardioides speluncae TaxID=2670337 RepID=UPI00137B45AE|nr:DUF4386 family protein [Nocardioides speluncae]
MTATNTHSPATQRVPHDARGYWRVLLAVLAPVAWLMVGIGGFIAPSELGGSGQETVAGIDAHRDLMRFLAGGQLFFLLTFVPGAIATIMALRRTKPVFTAVLGTWFLYAGLSGAANPPIDLIVLTGLEEGLAPDDLATLANALDGSIYTAVALLPVLLFITFGRIALGVLFWKANLAPRWLAVVMMVSPFIEFVPLGHQNVQSGVSWCLSAVAMTYVSLVLLRMTNDEFDLPPLPASTTP